LENVLTLVQIRRGSGLEKLLTLSGWDWLIAVLASGGGLYGTEGRSSAKRGRVKIALERSPSGAGAGHLCFRLAGD
jgi:hypothetical protein